MIFLDRVILQCNCVVFTGMNMATLISQGYRIFAMLKTDV